MRDRQRRRKGTEDMDMVCRNLHLVDGDTIRLSNLAQQSIHALGDFTLHDPFAILRCPNQVVLRIVNGMRGSTKGHKLFYDTPNADGYGRFVLSPRKNRPFIPRRKRRGILGEVR